MQKPRVVSCGPVRTKGLQDADRGGQQGWGLRGRRGGGTARGAPGALWAGGRGHGERCFCGVGHVCGLLTRGVALCSWAPCCLLHPRARLRGLPCAALHVAFALGAPGVCALLFPPPFIWKDPEAGRGPRPELCSPREEPWLDHSPGLSGARVRGVSGVHPGGQGSELESLGGQRDRF